jgi:hypothetical protein
VSWEAFLALAVPAILAGIGYLVKTGFDRVDARLALTQAIDTDLRNRRLDVYAELWKLTGALPQYPRRAPLTADDLLAFGERMRDWYFDTGGLYLSPDARDAYFAVQKAVGEILDTGAAGPLDDAAYDRVRERCSKLRTELAEDLLSRRAALDLAQRS